MGVSMPISSPVAASVSNTAALGTRAWSVYKSCKEGPNALAGVGTDVSSLHLLLKEVQETVFARPLQGTRQARVAEILHGCNGILSDLEVLVERYNTLGVLGRRVWDRLPGGHEEVSSLRERATFHASLLTGLISTSQLSVETKLDQLMNEIQHGRREASVISTQTLSSISSDDRVTWRNIRKELEDIGITVAAFSQNRDFIFEWFSDAIKVGAFEEKFRDSDRDSEWNQLEDDSDNDFSWTEGTRPNDLYATSIHNQECPNPENKLNHNDSWKLPRILAGPAVTTQPFFDAIDYSNYEEALEILNDTERSYLFDEKVVTRALSELCDDRRYRLDGNRENEEALVLSLCAKLPRIKCLEDSDITLYLDDMQVTLIEGLTLVAIERDWPKVLEILDPEADPMCANGLLHIAVKQGDLTRIHFLLEKGADVNFCSPIGWSPLRWAIALGKNEVARDLIQSGTFFLYESDGHVARDHGNTDGMKLLIEEMAKRPEDWMLALVLDMDKDLSDRDLERMALMMDEKDPRHFKDFQEDQDIFEKRFVQTLENYYQQLNFPPRPSGYKSIRNERP